MDGESSIERTRAGDAPVAAAAAAKAGLQIAAPVRRGRLGRHLPSIHAPLLAHTFDSFRFRDYRLLWAATVFSSGAFWLQQVVIGWLVYDHTRSPFLTSLALGVDALPILVVGPLGGLLADRSDRRKLLALVSGYQAVVTLTFALVVLLGSVETWHIFGFISVVGLAWVVIEPARMSLIPGVVPKENLVNAFALNSMGWSSTRLAGPVLGGAILALAGPGPALLAMVGLQLMAGAMAFGLGIRPSALPKLPLSAALQQLTQGARYIRGQPVILGMFLVSAMHTVLAIPFVIGLMPVYATEVFGVGPTGLGLLLSTTGAGGVVGTLGLASLGNVRRKGLVVMAAMAMVGVAIAAFSRNSSYALAFPLLLVIGFGTMLVFSAATASVYSIVRDDLRGRVAGLYTMTWGMMPLGSLVAGGLADKWGAPFASLIAGGLVAVCLAGIALSFRVLWRFD